MFVIILLVMVFIVTTCFIISKNSYKSFDVNWSLNDVLVGSFGSKEQFRDNLMRNYYYVPAKYINSVKSPINYIALYQSNKLFGNDGGIRYYGRIREVKLIKRKDIDFPIRLNNGEELYYIFGIEEWKMLPRTISVKCEYVSAPKFTNIFLLNHCTNSYELFNVDTQKDYRLLQALNNMVNDVSLKSKRKFVYRICKGLTIRLSDGYFNVFHKRRALFKASLKVSDFVYNPRSYFKMIKDKISKYF